MKVLLTCPTFPPRHNSGLGNAVYQQAVALVRNGFSVTVATGGGHRSHQKDTKYKFVVEEFPVSGASSFLQPIRGGVSDYMKFLTQAAFDIILMNAWQTWSSDLILKNLKKIHGRKYLYSHCISTNLFLNKKPVRSLIRYFAWRSYWFDLPRFMKALDGLIFVANKGSDSRFDDLRMAKKLGIKHTIIPNSYSELCRKFASTAPKWNDRKQMVAVGSYDWFKGHDFVLRAYAQSSMKNKVPLKIFGHVFTPFTNKLISLASSLGLDKRFVTFHEKVKKIDLLRECQQSNLLVSGSYTECQPLVLLDAMALGTPFIARSCGCIPSLKGGVCVSNELVASKEISRLCNDIGSWKKLSSLGQQTAATIFDPDIIGKKLCAFLMK